ncbi:MAG: nucleoside triphosphate pyrophosphohydrolase [Verrucomicrobiota bacterium JB023]|nr:nucleoside triphosphate pyrophosphohydrolase [Verrucomicrobiota bacterium JB023]
MTDEEMISCADKGRQIERLRAIMHRLRAPGGCPWDAEQTHESLVPNLLEEAYEVVAAIRESDEENLQEELGDLLLQVVFHSELAAEEQRFDMDEVARGVSDKLVRRHPHVFGDKAAGDSGAVLKQWEEIKRAEKGDEEKPYLHGVGKGLPALLRGAKIQKKASKVGFDWPDPKGIADKIEEEFGEVKDELERYLAEGDNREALEGEIGDLLFIVVNLARKLKIDPEVALEGTNRKFEKRFGYLEAKLREKGMSLEDASMEEMDSLWDEAKTLAK